MLTTISNWRHLDNLFNTWAPLEDWENNYFLDEDSQNFHISMDMPGITKENLKIEIENDQLKISAESDGKRKRKYLKTFFLPKFADAHKAEGTLENGVLTVVVPKTEAKKPKLIPIK